MADRDFNDCECEPRYERGVPIHTPECDEEWKQFQVFQQRKKAFHDAVERGEIPEIIR